MEDIHLRIQRYNEIKDSIWISCILQFFIVISIIVLAFNIKNEIIRTACLLCLIVFSFMFIFVAKNMGDYIDEINIHVPLINKSIQVSPLQMSQGIQTKVHHVVSQNPQVDNYILV